MVVQELVACDSEVQEALADTPEAVQKIAQAGPKAFHRVAVHTRTVRITTSILAGAMVDRTMVIVGLGEMVNVVLIGEELRPDFHRSEEHTSELQSRQYLVCRLLLEKKKRHDEVDAEEGLPIVVRTTNSTRDNAA